MTTDTQNEELEAAIADAELTEDEAAKARELVGQGGQIASVVPFLLAERDAPAEDEDASIAQPDAEATEPTKKQLDALDKEQVRHERRVREVMGAFVADFVACAECSGVGLVPPGPPEPQPQPHEWFRACETCAGFGLVLTGSSRLGQESRDCPTCKGRGYLEAIADGQPLADQASAQPVTPPPPPPAEQLGANENGGGALEFGVPAWMGDPTLSAPR